MRKLGMALAAGATAVLAACSSTDTSSPGTNGVSFSYTPCPGSAANQPLIMAVKDGTGPWTVITPVSGSYTATVHSSTAGLATVYGSGGSDDVEVVYALAGELQNHLSGACTSSQGNVQVAVNSLAAGEGASVALGWNTGSVSGPGNKTASVTTTGATGDLLAVLSNATSPAAKMILRRGIATATISALDFTAAEAFAPVTPTLSITGTGSEPVTFAQWYQTAGGFRDQIVYGSASTTLPTTYVGMPAAKQLAGDLHENWAYTNSTTSGGITSGRTVIAYWHDPVARTIAFAPLQSAPVVSVATTSPYPRLQYQWTMPTGHSYLYGYYYSGSQEAVIYATAGYLAGLSGPLVFPDLSGISGWQASWMPAAGVSTTWGMYDYAYNVTRGPFDPVTDGLQEQYNYWRGTITP